MSRSVAVAFLVIVATTLLASFHLVPVSVHMMLVTLSTIYIGSRFALKCWKVEGGTEETKHEHMGGAEQMQTKDAMMFPLIGSCVLFSLYCVYKFLPKDWVNAVIKLYFFIFGCIVLAQKLSQVLASTLPVPLVHRLLKAEYSIPNPLWLVAKIEDALMPCLKRVPFLGYNTPVPEDAPDAADAADADAAAEGSDEDEDAPAPAPVAPSEFWLPLSVLDLLSLALGVSVSIVYVSTNSWVCSNLFGMAFSIQGIEMLSLGSFLNGCILLCGLFVYDVFCKTTNTCSTRAQMHAGRDASCRSCSDPRSLRFLSLVCLSVYLSGVFGTDVMVTVAKSFDAPIKLLFPQFGFDADSRPSMLGLGDIVIPGIFIALLLRYDLWRNIQRLRAAALAKNQTLSTAQQHDLECLYCHVDVHGAGLSLATFHSNLVAYFVGLSTTVGVMYAFHAAQPALLYLVPACLGTALVTATLRGDIKQLWKYTENEEDKEAEKKKQDEAATPPAPASSSSTSGASTKESAVAAAAADAESVEATESEEGDEAEAESSTTATRRVTRQSSSKKKKRSARAD